MMKGKLVCRKTNKKRKWKGKCSKRYFFFRHENYCQNITIYWCLCRFLVIKMAAKNCVFWCELMLLPILMFAISCHKHKIHLYLLYGVINNSRNCCKDTLKDNLECNDYFFIYFILEDIIRTYHYIVAFYTSL